MKTPESPVGLQTGKWGSPNCFPWEVSQNSQILPWSKSVIFQMVKWMWRKRKRWDASTKMWKVLSRVCFITDRSIWDGVVSSRMRNTLLRLLHHPQWAKFAHFHHPTLEDKTHFSPSHTHTRVLCFLSNTFHCVNGLCLYNVRKKVVTKAPFAIQVCQGFM